MEDNLKKSLKSMIIKSSLKCLAGSVIGGIIFIYFFIKVFIRVVTFLFTFNLGYLLLENNSYSILILHLRILLIAFYKGALNRTSEIPIKTLAIIYL